MMMVSALPAAIPVGLMPSVPSEQEHEHGNDPRNDQGCKVTEAEHQFKSSMSGSSR
jgi:hypothetical protein